MSAVTNILHHRAKVIRQTSFLLDATIPDSVMTLTRQPYQDVYAEIILVGCSVSANGSVKIVGPSSTGVNQYTITDRTTGQAMDIKVTNGVISLSSSVLTPSAEPIIQDSLISGMFWKLFASDGVLAIETSAIHQNDLITLIDQSTFASYNIVVSDAVMGVTEYSYANTQETLTFSESGTKRGVVLFPFIGSIVLTGISGGTISIRGLNELGQPVNQDMTINDSMPCRFFHHDGMIHLKPAGQMESGSIVMMAEPDADLDPGDIITCLTGLEQVTVTRLTHHEHFYDFNGTIHHSEAHLNNIQ